MRVTVSNTTKDRPLKFRGICAVLILFFAMLAPLQPSGVRADELPLTVNVTEHLAVPDISNVPRIRFLMTADFPPFSFADAGGKLSGFNVELAREICRVLDVEKKCQLQVLPFGELEEALAARAGEAVIAGVAVTSKRRQRFAFSRPYLALPARFSINIKAAGGIASPAALSGKVIGVTKDTGAAEMLRAYFPDTKLREFETRQLMLDAMKKGDVPAIFTGALQLGFWQASDVAESCCRFLGGSYYSRYFLGEGMTIMSRKGEPLEQAFNAAIVALAKSGKLNELFLRYFPGGL